MAEKTIEEKIAIKQQEIESLDKKAKEIAKKKKQKKEEIKLLTHDYFMDILEKNDIDSSTKLLNIIQENKEKKETRSNDRPLRHTTKHETDLTNVFDRQERRERHNNIRSSGEDFGRIEGV